MSKDDKEEKINNNIEEQKDTNTTPEEETVVTIAPTIIDEDEMTREERKKDLSAIIPEFQETKTADQISLESKENQLKSDGCIVIGNIVDDKYNYIPDAKLPEMIDMKARKSYIKKNKEKKMNISEVDIKAAELKKKKMLNITSMISLCIIAFLVAAYLYYKNSPKDADFNPLTVTVELGKSLPTSKSAYVKPGIGKEVDEMSYTIDTKDVVVDKVGEYKYYVTHNNKRKPGIIKIVDTTPPAIETREVILLEGESFEASSFVVKCSDLSGCNYSFEDSNTENKYTQAGSYVVVVAATDAFGNKTIKKESLVIEKVGYVKFFKKQFEYDFSTNSQKVEKYEIHFTDFLSDSIILTGIHTTITTYSDEESYQTARKEYYGEVNYTCDDEAKTIKHVEKATTVGYYYSSYDQVINYLKTQGFEEVDS